MDTLCLKLKENELWLMKRILSYAKTQGFTKYSSTLVEAWRISIAGLTDTIAHAFVTYGCTLPEFFPEEQYENDPIAQFGVLEARRHRERGIRLSMFLGLYKYYRYTYQDFVNTLDAPSSTKKFWHAFVERCFDRIEIAFCSEWAAVASSIAIDELQKANREMTNEKNKYLTLFESLEFPTFLVDEHGFIENMNGPAAELLGFKALEGARYYSLDGKHYFSEKMIFDIIPWLGDSIKQFLNSEENAICLEMTEPEGQGGRRFYILLSKMKDVSGKFRGGVFVLQDVTEKHRMERLKEDVEQITRHDLKVPLSGILTAINCILHENSISDDQRMLLNMAKESGYSMLKMINRSMDLLKMESGRYQLVPECIDLSSILNLVIAHVDGLAKGSGVKIMVTAEGSDAVTSQGPFLLGEKLLLYTALGNLVTNALEASPPDSTVCIDVAVGESCRIKITNRGEVPKQIKDRFFEKYSTWGKKSGTGLGTYSAKLIVETMGGEISMKSEDSMTEVALRVPLAPVVNGQAATCN